MYWPPINMTNIVLYYRLVNHKVFQKGSSYIEFSYTGKPYKYCGFANIFAQQSLFFSVKSLGNLLLLHVAPFLHAISNKSTMLLKQKRTKK